MKALCNYISPLEINTAMEISEKKFYLMIWNSLQAVLLSKNKTTKPSVEQCEWQSSGHVRRGRNKIYAKVCSSFISGRRHNSVELVPLGEGT